MTETYRLYAIKYGHREATRKEHFLGGDPDGDRPMPMDYFVWLAQSEAHTFVIDTGFAKAVGDARGRQQIRQPAECFRLLGVEAADVRDVIITHLHYDHIGTVDDFPNATIHIQQKEVEFVVGPAMLTDARHAFEPHEIDMVVRALHAGRVDLIDGAAELAPGLSVHFVGGHTGGTQVVRVHTERGWVVLASDSSHYYENFEADRPFSIAWEPDRVRAGFRALRALADSEQHIVPGHDPMVLDRYPAPSAELEGIAVRLDVMPKA
ncbi:MAG: N-acyl homoserine lactonase family protein [Dehalococcoidia bacterium]